MQYLNRIYNSKKELSNQKSTQNTSFQIREYSNIRKVLNIRMSQEKKHLSTYYKIEKPYSCLSD